MRRRFAPRAYERTGPVDTLMCAVLAWSSRDCGRYGSRPLHTPFRNDCNDDSASREDIYAISFPPVDIYKVNLAGVQGARLRGIYGTGSATRTDSNTNGLDRFLSPEVLCLGADEGLVDTI